jgi:hypothetical protein
MSIGYFLFIKHLALEQAFSPHAQPMPGDRKCSPPGELYFDEACTQPILARESRYNISITTSFMA